MVQEASSFKNSKQPSRRKWANILPILFGIWGIYKIYRLLEFRETDFIHPLWAALVAFFCLILYAIVKPNWKDKNFIALTLITSLFFIWGFALNMNPILIAHLKK